MTRSQERDRAKRGAKSTIPMDKPPGETIGLAKQRVAYISMKCAVGKTIINPFPNNRWFIFDFYLLNCS